MGLEERVMETERDASNQTCCPYCRRVNKPDEIFCSACGGKLQKEAESAKPASSRRRAPIVQIGLASAAVLIILWVLTSEFRRNYLPAQLGWHSSQYRVGAAYKKGSAVARDYAKASRWFKASAEGGFAPAHFEYGVLRLYGLGVLEDRGDAMEHIKKAADAGLPEAQFLAGSLLLNAPAAGPAERREAEQWLRLAAGKRFMPAEYCLASEYIAGSRLAKDYAAADVLLRDLENNGFASAKSLREYLRKVLMTDEERGFADKWEMETGR
jgi:TPR repeat protein